MALDPVPLLPLETWRRIIGWHPFHFWGMAGTGLVALDSGCDTLVNEYAWQQVDMAGREEIRDAIVTAEQRLFDYLDYSVAPHFTSAIVPWPQLADRQLMRSGPWDAQGRWLSVHLPEGYVQGVGIEARVALSAGAAVVVSDGDGDTINDTFTVGPIAIGPTVTNPNEIAVYVAAANRFDGSGVSERWRIAPVNVAISGGFVTIKGPYWLLARPVLYEGITNIGPNGLDPASPGNFQTTVDVYRRFLDGTGTTAATAHALIEWETRPCHGWWCCCSDCVTPTTAFSGSPYDPAAVAQAASRVALRNAELGIVAPAEAVYNATTGIWSSLDWTVCDQPDHVTVRYLAGYPTGDDGQMARQWQIIVARLAAAELGKPICGCEAANRQLAYWQFDVSRAAGANDEQYAVAARDLDNPLGTRRGHIYAWRQIENLAQVRGFLG